MIAKALHVSAQLRTIKKCQQYLIKQYAHVRNVQFAKIRVDLKFTSSVHVLSCFSHMGVVFLRTSGRQDVEYLCLHERNRLLKIFHRNTELSCVVLRADIHQADFKCTCTFSCKRTACITQKNALL